MTVPLQFLQMKQRVAIATTSHGGTMPKRIHGILNVSLPTTRAATHVFGKIRVPAGCQELIDAFQGIRDAWDFTQDIAQNDPSNWYLVAFKWAKSRTRDKFLAVQVRLGRLDANKHENSQKVPRRPPSRRPYNNESSLHFQHPHLASTRPETCCKSTLRLPFWALSMSSIP